MSQSSPPYSLRISTSWPSFTSMSDQRRAVMRLPDRYAKIVTLYYLRQMAYEEIAEAMEIPMGTLKTWMFRARKDLRHIVEQELGQDEA